MSINLIKQRRARKLTKIKEGGTVCQEKEREGSLISSSNKKRYSPITKRLRESLEKTAFAQKQSESSKSGWMVI